MKNILVIIGICFALSLCNLSQKLHGGSGSSGSGSDANVEKGQPNVLQQAALAGGKEIKWEKQGMSFTVPPNWTEVENESKSFVWRSPTAGGATLNVNISPLGEDFPVDSSLEAGYEQQRTRAKNGEVDEVKWVEIDGLKGVQFREANPEKPDGFRRLQWEAFRKYSGQVQMINLMLATDGEHFDRHKDAMYGILYSTKIAH